SHSGLRQVGFIERFSGRRRSALRSAPPACGRGRQAQSNLKRDKKMFCPKCATQNPEGGSFCRGCGANISLVPQAMTGQLTRANEEKGLTEDEACAIPGRRRRRRELTLDSAFKNIFIGIAFLLIAIALSRSIGAGWWFWMLIPAFSLMGSGVAQY